MKHEGYVFWLSPDGAWGYIRQPHWSIPLRFEAAAFGGVSPRIGMLVSFTLAKKDSVTSAESVELLPPKIELLKYLLQDESLRHERATSAPLALASATAAFIDALRRHGPAHEAVRSVRNRLVKAGGDEAFVTACEAFALPGGARQATRGEGKGQERQPRVERAPSEEKPTAPPTAREARPPTENRRKREEKASPQEQAESVARDHRVQAQRPVSAWWLFIDETGGSFSGRPPQQGPRSGFVGVLIPEGAPLKSLPRGTHFSSMDDHARCEILSRLLSAPVGILGFDLSQVPGVPGDRWPDGVILLLSWVLRLLPLRGDTRLHIRIEQRAEHKAGLDWGAILRSVLMTLGQRHPKRAARVQADIELIAKDTHPWLAYADAIAGSLFSRDKRVEELIRDARLHDGCLFPQTEPWLQEIWDIVDQGESIEPRAWERLLRDPSADTRYSLPHTILGRLSRACRSNLELWKRLFDHTLVHLDSKAIRLATLGRQVEWLAACRRDQGIPKRLELAWRVAELERGNHEGRTDERLIQRLDALQDELFEEDAQLVCQADLDRAVLRTNRMEFEQASRELDRWQDLPIAIPGRQRWARVQSSLAQHAAFLGELEKAEALFERAIRTFQALSDPELARREISQTACYRAIAAIDSEMEIEEIRERVLAVTSLEPQAIARMAGSTADHEKYAHHLLLRYLVAHGSPQEREAYLSAQASWASERGHPWPLILACRALLLRSVDPAAALECMVAGATAAFDPAAGPTVRLIGATLWAVARAWGQDSPVTEDDLRELGARIPGARVEILRAAFESPLEPPERVLREMLPFNLH